MSFLRPFRTHLHSNILLFSASLTLSRAVALGVHNRLNSNLLDRIQPFSPKPCHTESPLLVSHTVPVSHKRALIKRRECTYTQQKRRKKMLKGSLTPPNTRWESATTAKATGTKALRFVCCAPDLRHDI